MSASTLTNVQEQVLRSVHAQEGADLYDLAQAVGTGPRTVQEAVRQLAEDDLVYVSDRGVRVHCTRAGDRWVRNHQ